MERLCFVRIRFLTTEILNALGRKMFPGWMMILESLRRTDKYSMTLKPVLLIQHRPVCWYWGTVDLFGAIRTPCLLNNLYFQLCRYCWYKNSIWCSTLSVKRMCRLQQCCLYLQPMVSGIYKINHFEMFHMVCVLSSCFLADYAFRFQLLQSSSIYDL